jgi:hypothetical protein
MNGWMWKTKQLLLHAPVISKLPTASKARLCVQEDIYNPLLWSVVLQTDNGMRALSVHPTRFAAEHKMLRMKGMWPTEHVHLSSKLPRGLEVEEK